MRAILLSLALMLCVQTVTHAETTASQSHIHDCAGILSADDKDWVGKNLDIYGDETGIQIFLITPSLKSEVCVPTADETQKNLERKKSTVFIMLMSDPDKYWIEVTLTDDLVRRFGLRHVTINLGHDEKVLQTAKKALIGASDLVRNHFAYMDDVAALLNSQSTGDGGDPFESDVTTPLEGTAPIEPSDIPPDEGDGPEQSDTPKPFQREGQPI